MSEEAINNNNNNKCPKCGFKMKPNDRFCIHCGYINFDSSKNEYLETYEKNAQRIKPKKEEKKEEELEDTSKLPLTDYKSKEETATQDRNKIEGTLVKAHYKAIRIGVCLVIFVALLLVYSYIKDKQERYVSDAQKIVKVIQTYYENNDACKGEGTRYFKFMYSDLENRYGLKIKSQFHDMDYFGYVKIIRHGDDIQYFISINDGRFGIRETEVSKLSPFKVFFYGSNYDSIKDTTC